ncbi:MAG: radical SAM protein [Candidatus Sumerlaeota bacterium]
MSTDPKSFRHLFGPVPSRRLGRSLGVDLTPGNTCSYNCVYCQLGKTVNHTAERREWAPTGEVIDELRRWHEQADTAADVVTLAGSGEPTLHTGFGRVLDAARSITGLPTVLLTNGSLLHMDDVRRDAALADIVKVTLSASDEAMWQRLHRPAEGLTFSNLEKGLLAFREEYEKTLWLEVMVVRGINDSPEAMRPLARLAKRHTPDQVQINTVVRPPAESDAQAAEFRRLEELALVFDPAAKIIGGYASASSSCVRPAREVLAALACRHPLTAEEARPARRRRP